MRKQTYVGFVVLLALVLSGRRKKEKRGSGLDI
jgi:hypothetical protein